MYCDLYCNISIYTEIYIDLRQNMSCKIIPNIQIYTNVMWSWENLSLKYSEKEIKKNWLEIFPVLSDESNHSICSKQHLGVKNYDINIEGSY